MSQKRLIVACMARTAVWVVVLLWCFSPIVWLLVMLAGSGEAAPQPAPPPLPRVGNEGFLVKIMSSMVMIGAFLYGVWCSVGVVMGFGLDRSITVAESLILNVFMKAKVEQTPSSIDVELDESDSVPCPE